VNPRYLLDTNVLSEPVRREPDAAVVNKLREHGGELATASVVWHELIFGVGLLRSSRKRTAIERYLTEVISAALPILPYDATAAEWHGEQRARLLKVGRPPAFADGQIAAVAAIHDLILVTDNVRDFEHFDGLRVERWHRAVKS
jgi:tRNA(fMet)-specific endonuclease VapC